MTSRFIFSSRTFFFNNVISFSNASSMTALVSLTICPTIGRSSLATSFIPFNTWVNSPFLPSTDTRISFKLSIASACSIFSKAAFLIASNLSFICLVLLYWSFLYSRIRLLFLLYSGKRKRTRPQRDEFLIYTRGTTLIPMVSLNFFLITIST